MNVYAYLAALAVLSLAAFSRMGDTALRRTMIVLLLSWVLHVGVIKLTGIQSPWAWFLGVDIAAAWVILWHPRSRLQGLIGVSFIIGIAVHVGYGVNHLHSGYDFIRATEYWLVREVLGFARLGLIGAWAAWDGILAYTGHRGRRHALVDPSGHGGAS